MPAACVRPRGMAMAKLHQSTVMPLVMMIAGLRPDMGGSHGNPRPVKRVQANDVDRDAALFSMQQVFSAASVRNDGERYRLMSPLDPFEKSRVPSPISL
jgi:hypothetical protein